MVPVDCAQRDSLRAVLSARDTSTTLFEHSATVRGASSWPGGPQAAGADS